MTRVGASGHSGHRERLREDRRCLLRFAASHQLINNLGGDVVQEDALHVEARVVATLLRRVPLSLLQVDVLEILTRGLAGLRDHRSDQDYPRAGMSVGDDRRGESAHRLPDNDQLPGHWFHRRRRRDRAGFLSQTGNAPRARTTRARTRLTRAA